MLPTTRGVTTDGSTVMLPTVAGDAPDGARRCYHGARRCSRGWPALLPRVAGAATNFNRRSCGSVSFRQSVLRRSSPATRGAHEKQRPGMALDFFCSVMFFFSACVNGFGVRGLHVCGGPLYTCRLLHPGDRGKLSPGGRLALPFFLSSLARVPPIARNFLPVVS